MNVEPDTPFQYRQDGTPLFECPYGSCGECHYVGPEIGFNSKCPMCGAHTRDAFSVWPNMQWTSAATDIAFLFDHCKLELLTIAVAAYFEGLLWAFFNDAFVLIHPETRSFEIEGLVRSIGDEGERWVAGQKEHRRRHQIIHETFEEYRGVKRRLTNLSQLVFGKPLDELLTQHVTNADRLIGSRKNIHKWRNLILHRGVPLDQVWSKEQQVAAPAFAIRFIRDCWDAFRTLNNELIHKPYINLRNAKSQT